MIYLPLTDQIVDKSGVPTTVGKRWINDVGTPLSPSGTGTIYTSTDGGVTTQLMSLAQLLLTGMVRNITVGVTSTPVTNATNVYADTGLTASITPSLSTSSILVLVFQNGCSKDTGDTAIQLKLVRGSTLLAQLSDGGARTGTIATNDIGTIAGGIKNSPAATTAVTYKTQFASKDNTANVNVQTHSETSLMVLIEVLA